MIHAVTLKKISSALGPHKQGTEIRYVSKRGWADEDEARGRVFRILKRENPGENQMCWALVAVNDISVEVPTFDSDRPRVPEL